MDLALLRAVVILLLGSAGYLLQPFAWPPPVAAVVGIALGGVVVAAEYRLKHASLVHVLGASIGALAGLLAALAISTVLQQTAAATSTLHFIQVAVLGACLYVGVIVGARKGELLNLSALGGLFGGERSSRTSMNLLDTSVIIDGRIADIAATGFLSGTLAIPQFVLSELQLVADSPDSLKRNRGRRGLDVLQRLQKLPQLDVQILEDDFPHLREVDSKLVELGRLYGCKLVTNDFNLNKVAQLKGVEVLSINELANALKPVVLPGEIMRVFILKEGKEYNQGVAYLDDGTMVVVDNARRMISRTIDIAVTSVLQTTAGKMIFGKFDERTHGVYEKGTNGSTGDHRDDRRPREQSSAAAST